MRRLDAALLLASFAVLLGCASSIDPAIKADLDRRAAAFPTSEETFPPAEAFLPPSLMVGQWTQHRIRDDLGGVQLLTYKLVGQDDGGFWLETLVETYQGREVTKMHVFLFGGRDRSAMEIRSIRVKKGKAAPIDVDAGDLVTVRQQYQYTLDLLAVSFEGLVKDDARVPAGRFIGCFKAATKKPWGPWRQPSDLCAHPSVPLSGVVLAKPLAGGAVMELVAFGLTGAEGEL